MCQRCECNNNIDETATGNCAQATGECLKCLYNTAGPHCEYCMDGFYGDATRQECLSKKKSYLYNIKIKFQIFCR